MTLRRRIARAVAVLAGLLTAVALVQAPAAPAHAAPGGTGPYPADYETSWRLRDHTIYRPADVPDGVRLPILAWGNGACRADGTWFENILKEFASHGFLVIANGSPGGRGSTDAEMLTEAIDWAVEENGRRFSDLRGKIDTESIAVAGQSCGGLEAYEIAASDPSVDTTMIFNSGMLDDANNDQLARLRAPIVYIVGGPSDIAYPNAMDDWNRIPQTLPAFMGNLDVGHFGTFGEPNGGEFGRVGSAWLKWRLKGDAAAGSLFTGANCGLCNTEWDIQRRNM